MAGKNGGARPGAGRKSTGRKKVNFYLTDDETAFFRDELQKIRTAAEPTLAEIIERENPEISFGEQIALAAAQARGMGSALNLRG